MSSTANLVISLFSPIFHLGRERIPSSAGVASRRSSGVCSGRLHAIDADTKFTRKNLFQLQLFAYMKVFLLSQNKEIALKISGVSFYLGDRI